MMRQNKGFESGAGGCSGARRKPQYRRATLQTRSPSDRESPTTWITPGLQTRLKVLLWLGAPPTWQRGGLKVAGEDGQRQRSIDHAASSERQPQRCRFGWSLCRGLAPRPRGREAA